MKPAPVGYSLADMWSDQLGTRWRSSIAPRPEQGQLEVAVGEVVGDVNGRVCLLVDDMIDTAGTICQAAAALKAHGAKAVIAAATTRSFPGLPAAAERVEFEEVIVTNTLPISEGVNIPKLRRCSRWRR